MVSCRVTRDVYSLDGLVKLIDKGHLLRAMNGGLKNGQARVFVLWERAVNPDGHSLIWIAPGPTLSVVPVFPDRLTPTLGSLRRGRVHFRPV
ncbi:TrbI/VirB10 family protein [Escherichia coli]|uniref:TrbI/VirB10 family protein n=1 Tax=Escherichia coli TaxID=562 RepID=UPI00249F55B8|nr:TrbI/VirB10 family protein [Escherichia coli]